ncbi:hypothetical protein MB02_08560 [Croceicoccus estronivorus]|uniref:hypothetical protein n=1 Tax=Croceicoccus estronivorus TaxID=1172626 RepID=UPI000834019F|nr:hypothetical protein [Croceicoccus estronivorus]OCC24112.1 hypothetical protein MB02_08560 [Croceicoccus estronivorus]
MQSLSRLAPLVLLVATSLLASCQKADNEPGPGGVTVGEARALDEAAEMIESQRPIEQKSRESAPPDTTEK